MPTLPALDHRGPAYGLTRFACLAFIDSDWQGGISRLVPTASTVHNRCAHVDSPGDLAPLARAAGWWGVEGWG